MYRTHARPTTAGVVSTAVMVLRAARLVIAIAPRSSNRGEERGWEPELTLDEVRWARALLQSRPLAIGGRGAPKRFFLVPFVDLLNTWLVPDDAQRVNVKLKSLRPSRFGSSDDDDGDDDAMRPRAVLATTRPVRAGEELLLSYGLDLRQTTARYALLNYGIVGNSATEELPARCCGDGGPNGSMGALSWSGAASIHAGSPSSSSLSSSSMASSAHSSSSRCSDNQPVSWIRKTSAMSLQPFFFSVFPDNELFPRQACSSSMKPFCTFSPTFC